jgi:hypothetical protein
MAAAGISSRLYGYTLSAEERDVGISFAEPTAADSITRTSGVLVSGLIGSMPFLSTKRRIPIQT